MGQITVFIVSILLPFHLLASNPLDFLKDPDSLVNENFKVSKDFEIQTRFWFKIYTEYNSDQYILHDRDNPQIIFDVVSKSDHPGKTPSLIQTAVINEYKSALDSLATGDLRCNLCPKIAKLYSTEIPKNKAIHRSFYQLKKSQLRFQTGQKDFIQKGLHYHSSYEAKLAQLVELFDIPKELIAIAFLESSFNTEARSRLNATGIWQFMRSTGNDFMLIESKQDHRLNPLISTLAAFQFLKQLHKSLGRWDLAIWSYNSGAQHIRNALKTFERPTMTLSDFFKFYKHPSIGFASESFFPSFLALAHALAYRDKIFKKTPDKYLNVDHESLNFYVSLCPIKPNWFYNQLSNTPDLRKLNRHLLSRYNNTNFSRGTILVADRELTKRRYYKVPPDLYTARYPKNWRLHIKKLRCNP